MKLNTLEKFSSLFGLPLLALTALACLPANAQEILPLKNADFENGNTSWIIRENNPMSQVSPDAARTGKAGLLIVDNDEKYGSGVNSEKLPITGGGAYRINYWAQSSPQAGCGVYFTFFTADGKPIGGYQPVSLIPQSDNWKQQTFRVRASENAASMNLWIHSFGGFKGKIMVDDIELKQATPAETSSMPLPDLPDPTATLESRKSPAYIIMKLDDMVNIKGRVPLQWKQVADVVRERKIKTTMGIICNSLEGDNPEYTNFIKEQYASGLVEFWDHGYEHKQWKEGDKDFYSFSGPSYEQQKGYFSRSQALAKEKLGFPLESFGPGFGATDENTVRAMKEIPELKIWLYGDRQNQAGKIILDRIGEVNIESPLFSPSLDKFIEGYKKYPNRDYFVIQGHPAQWTPERFDQFVKIVDFLISQKAVFVTPTEYVKLRNLKPTDYVRTAAAQPVVAQVAAPPAVAGTQSLVSNDFTAADMNKWKISGKSVSEPKVVDAKIEGAPFTKALQVEVAAPAGSQPWDLRLVAPITAPAIGNNDMVLVQFWARSTPKTRVLAVFQQAAAPNTKTIRQAVALSPNWKKFTFYAPVKGGYAANNSNFEMQLGQGIGKIELTGFKVENLGAISFNDAKIRFGEQSIDYFGGEDVNDDWIPAANARIEKYRKADLKLRVVDKNGKPITGAKIALKQTKSSFRWGTAVNYYLLEQSPDGDKYREQVKRLYNTAVVENDMKWRAADGNPANQKRAKDTVAWLRANGLEVRGHNLVWGSDKFAPKRLFSLSPDEARAEIRKRVLDTTTDYKGQLYVWDVVNEATTETSLFDKVGWQTFSDAFRWTKEADPNVRTAYNDYNISNSAPDNGNMRFRVEARIQQLIDAGAPLDILGDQAHITVPLTTMPNVLKIWDDWGAKYKKPIEITEFDVNMPDDEVHGKYVRDYLTAAFSNPNIESFLVWQFWEKAHWLGGPGALFRADWSPRPGQLAYEDLVLNKWRTNQTLTADATGSIQTRGFMGDYEVEITANGKTQTQKVSLDKSGLKQQITLQ